MSVISKLQALNFHDSRLVEIRLSFNDPNLRLCVIEIDYYDWEGNASRRKEDANAVWLSRRLRISIGFLAHIEFNAPDLVNRAHDIDQVEVGYGLPAFQSRYAAFKREFPKCSYPLFEDGSEVVSLRFLTQNYEENQSGSFWIVGGMVDLEWLSAPRHTGQLHIPITNA